MNKVLALVQTKEQQQTDCTYPSQGKEPILLEFYSKPEGTEKQQKTV
jgi:hypothetical protein